MINKLILVKTMRYLFILIAGLSLSFLLNKKAEAKYTNVITPKSLTTFSSNSINNSMTEPVYGFKKKKDRPFSFLVAKANYYKAAKNILQSEKDLFIIF